MAPLCPQACRPDAWWRPLRACDLAGDVGSEWGVGGAARRCRPAGV